MTAEQPRLVKVGPDTWAEAEWAKRLCVFGPEARDADDPIACREHRRQLDAQPMRWEGSTN